MKLNLNKGNNKMRYEQKAALQDSNKARMYEEKKQKNKLNDNDVINLNDLDYCDVMDLTSEITYRLQDLKFIKGNDKDYNFEVDDEMRAIICKKLNIGEE
jgi:hypothetical protein